MYGNALGYNYQIGRDPVTNQVAAPQQQQIQLDPSIGNYGNDPLAYRQGLTSNVIKTASALRSIAQEGARLGIDVTRPDLSDPNGGPLYQAWLLADTALKSASDELEQEYEMQKIYAPLLAEGKVIRRPGVDTSGAFYNNADNFMSTAIDPIVLGANNRLGDNFYDQADADAVNKAIRDPRIAYYTNQIQADPTNADYYQRQIDALLTATKSTFVDRSGGSGNGSPNPSISAYVKDFSNLSLGNGFTPTDRFDAGGNRIDEAKPAWLVGRQLGFTPDGKKFIVDRVEKKINPQGGIVVEAIDSEGNALPLDKSNISGTVRSFIETNEGAGALKDLNSFFQSQGYNPAVTSIPATDFGDPTTKSTQSDTSPQVLSIRKEVSDNLDLLSGSGFKNFLKSASFGAIFGSTPTELKFQTRDGQEIVVTKSGDKYNFENFENFYGKPSAGKIKIGDQEFKVDGTFKNIPKERITQIIDDFGYTGVKLKNSKGEDVQLPSSSATDLTPRQQQALSAFEAKVGRKPTESELTKLLEKYK